MTLLLAATGLTLEAPSRSLHLRPRLRGSRQLSVTRGQAQKLNCSACRVDVMALVSSDLSFSFNFEDLINSKLIIRLTRQ